MAAAAPNAMKSQPMGLFGRREATKAPTVAKGTAVERTRGMRATSLTGHSRNPRATIATTRVHKGHASQAVRWFILPTPRTCSRASPVTTPLYSTTASKALRRAAHRVGRREARVKAEVGIASTAFRWAHASWDNAKNKLLGAS